MPMEQEKRTLIDDIRHYLNVWHQFPIDYWWRKRYNVPFGSPAHRTMNLFDMAIEYQEELDIVKSAYDAQKVELEESDGIRLSQEEIDKDFDDLDIETIKV